MGRACGGRTKAQPHRRIRSGRRTRFGLREAMLAWRPCEDRCRAAGAPVETGRDLTRRTAALTRLMNPVSVRSGMEVLTSYIPRIAVMRWRARRTARPLPGGALFADISGSPAVRNAGRTFGPRRGAEELTLHLNAVYDALIGEVDGCGGVSLRLPGTRSPAGLTATTGCGSGVRLAMQEAMKRLAVVRMGDGREVTLAVKISWCRPRAAVCPGDPAIRVMDVLAGRTLVRMASAAAATHRGEVVLDEPTAAALGTGSASRPREPRRTATPGLSCRGGAACAGPD